MACQLSWIKKVYHRLLQPDHCLLCLALIRDQHHAICSDCQLDLPWLLHGCHHCALPIPPGDSECTSCQQQRQPFHLACCAWQYEFPVNRLIAGFKYNKHWPAGRLLGELFAEHLQFLHDEQGLELADALIPVPLSAKRQRQRGYNQARMIAGWLSRQLGRPVLDKAVRRIRHTQVQQGLDAQQRQANMRNAFDIQRPELIASRHLALVDDVLTTGATCAALARCLLAAGARRVDVYCLARTPAARTGGSLYPPP